jgi:hypothetical protein
VSLQSDLQLPGGQVPHPAGRAPQQGGIGGGVCGGERGATDPHQRDMQEPDNITSNQV